MHVCCDLLFVGNRWIRPSGIVAGSLKSISLSPSLYLCDSFHQINCILYILQFFTDVACKFGLVRHSSVNVRSTWEMSINEVMLKDKNLFIRNSTCQNKSTNEHVYRYLFIVIFETHMHNVRIFAWIKLFIDSNASSGHFQENRVAILWQFVQLVNHINIIERHGILRCNVAQHQKTVHVAFQFSIAWQIIQIVSIAERMNHF